LHIDRTIGDVPQAHTSKRFRRFPRTDWLSSWIHCRLVYAPQDVWLKKWYLNIFVYILGTIGDLDAEILKLCNEHAEGSNR